MQQVADKLEIIELANKLFMYCDEMRWEDLCEEVFTPQIWFDMSSAGGGDARMVTAREICDMWAKGFEGLDAIHHQAGHYLVDIADEEADIYAYAVATHYKKAATKGNVRSFVGSYNLEAIRTEKGWRLDLFRYNLKYIDGNVSME